MNWYGIKRKPNKIDDDQELVLDNEQQIINNYYWCHKVILDDEKAIVFIHVDTSLLSQSS